MQNLWSFYSRIQTAIEDHWLSFIYFAPLMYRYPPLQLDCHGYLLFPTTWVFWDRQSELYGGRWKRDGPQAGCHRQPATGYLRASQGDHQIRIAFIIRLSRKMNDTNSSLIIHLCSLTLPLLSWKNVYRVYSCYITLSDMPNIWIEHQECMCYVCP